MVSSNGKLSIAIYTSRHIKKGEELSFDYSCVTESLVEYREAICLCGKERCRGSFLSLADGGDLFSESGRGGRGGLAGLRGL